MKLCIFTKYTANGPSSRYRFLGYLPALDKAGYQVSIRPFFSDLYLKRLFSNRSVGPFYVIWRILLRITECMMARRYDLVWIEGELVPFLPSFFERILNIFLPKRRYHDFDDAIWLRYAEKRLLRKKFPAIIKNATGITAGNSFLAQHFAPANVPTLILPTVVRWEKYEMIKAPLSGSTIGWIGTPKTVFFLEDLLPALEKLASNHSFTLRVIGAKISSEKFEVDCQPWSQERETQLLSELDIGIMPLRDDQWSRGKCGLKLIQYLAAGVPSVASPVGVNTQIIENSSGGFLAQGIDQWVSALSQLLRDPDMRKAMGAKARQWAKNEMTLESQAPRLIDFLDQSSQVPRTDGGLPGERH